MQRVSTSSASLAGVAVKIKAVRTIRKPPRLKRQQHFTFALREPIPVSWKSAQICSMAALIPRKMGFVTSVHITGPISR